MEQTEKYKGCAANIATPTPEGKPFWQKGIYEGENSDSYFFRIEGKLTLFPKSRVFKIEFIGQPTGQRGASQ